MAPDGRPQTSDRHPENMGWVGGVDGIVHERDFKVLCDGLLRFELGPCVQTFASAGADQGVDAEFIGTFGGIDGRWVFQYKFRAPSESLSRRRDWLRTRFSDGAKRRSEFRRPGVEGADAYVLVTNIPVTVQLVRTLSESLSACGLHKTRLLVWDPSRLNALMKGREHLARSWSGIKERRCRERIVLPMWRWLERAVGQVGAPTNLWPLTTGTASERVRKGSFNDSWDWRYWLTTAVDDDLLRSAMRDPQWEFARHVAYPHALEPLEEVVRSGEVLVEIQREKIEDERNALELACPDVQRAEPEGLSTWLAYAVLEVRWGLPGSGTHRVLDGRVSLFGRSDFAAPSGLADILEVRVRQGRAGAPPSEVVEARERFSRAVVRAWNALWYVVELGIDAEVVEPVRR